MLSQEVYLKISVSPLISSRRRAILAYQNEGGKKDSLNRGFGRQDDKCRGPWLDGGYPSDIAGDPHCEAYQMNVHKGHAAGKTSDGVRDGSCALARFSSLCRLSWID